MFYELLQEDFEQIVMAQKVASEESIRFLVDNFKRDGLLENPCLIHSNDVVQYLKDLYFFKNYGHYQLIVEFGTRDLLVQAKPDCIHYSAIDIYYDSSQYIVFVADHYHGKEYHSYREVYEQLELPIRFIVAGGSPYQADAEHCPIFTLQHLLLTAWNENLKEQLSNLARQTSEKYIQLPWFELCPDYNLYMQSFSGLIKYIDYRKNKQTSAAEEDCEELKRCHFDTRLSQYLECNADNKIQNHGIKKLSAQFRDIVYQAKNDYTAEQLVDVFYAERYPQVVDILKRALKFGETHPIVSFIFSNQPFLDLLHRNKNITKSRKIAPSEQFFLIWYNDTILKLIETKLLCPNWLFQSLTQSDCKKMQLDSSRIKLAYDNLDLLEERVAREDEFSQFDFSPQELLFLSNTRAYSSPVVKELFFSGHIDREYVKSISHKILPTGPFSSKSASDWKEVLSHIVETHSPHSVVASFTPTKSSKQASLFSNVDAKEEEYLASDDNEFFGLMCFGKDSNAK